MRILNIFMSFEDKTNKTIREYERRKNIYLYVQQCLLNIICEFTKKKDEIDSLYS